MSESRLQIAPLAYNHISVDCVVLGWDGSSLQVLLVSRRPEGDEYHDMKLPGSLIYQDEDLDDAAERVLRELTGLDDTGLVQFKAFGSKDRTRNPRDVIWLERAQKAKVDRIVTVGYLTLVKISRTVNRAIEGHNALWVPVGSVGPLAFDHNQILTEALSRIRNIPVSSPERLFSLLPKKFTLSQLRKLYEVVTGKNIEVRNFHKKVATMPYVVALNEFETGVAHRAARLYRFDRKIHTRK